MIISVGEILIDKFPNSSRIGGAPLNFAYHLHMFGLSVALISRIGHDCDGKRIIKFLKYNNFPTDYIQKDNSFPTGYVDINLDDEGVAEYKIIKNVAYDHLTPPSDLKKKDINLVYFGTLIQRTSNGLASLNEILSKGLKSICDINLRPGCYTRKTIENSLIHCDILKLNDWELSQVNEMFIKKKENDEVVSSLMRDYSIDAVSLTLGVRGSKLYYIDEIYNFEIEKHKGIVDTVGAGDAYCAILAIGLLRKWSPEIILGRASEFAADICRINGAIPENDNFYDKYYKKYGMEK